MVLQDQIAAHAAARAECNAILDELRTVDLPDIAPDVSTAEAARAEAAATHEFAVAVRSRVEGARERIAQLAEQHRAQLAKIGDDEHEAALYAAVSDRCNGKTAPKVSLQRWILAAYLANICEYANRRLDSMTSGRYQLLLGEASRANAPGGLDLFVDDSHTGEQRPVATLSGGETFQASLALALGVADSVEAHSGGVGLDALFIDEGFGTLDAESLDLAMDQLDALREGGRIVGLISHVTTPRERFRLGIEVIATSHGSTTRVRSINEQ